MTTAKDIKAILKTQFPGIRFFVKQFNPHPSGAIIGTMNITWTNGPTRDEVKAAVVHLELPAEISWSINRRYTKAFLETFMARQYEKIQAGTRILGKDDDAFLHCVAPSTLLYLNGYLSQYKTA